MSRKFNSNSNVEDLGPIYWTILTTVLICFVLMISQRGDARLRAEVQSNSDDAISPLITLISKPVRAVEDFLFTLEDRQRAFEENKALRAELQALRDERASLVLMQEKVDNYEQILGVTFKSDQFVTKTAARAISDIEGPFVRALLINAGRKDGIVEGDAVLSSQGMIGHVILSGRSSARVLRLDDISSRIPVMSERSKAVAILAGDNSDFLKLIFIGRGMDWKIGDRVVTSGDEGRLPRGLYVGEVIEKNEESFRVKPIGLHSPINLVFAPKFKKIETPALVPDSNLDVGSINTPVGDTTQSVVSEGATNE